MPRPAPTQRTVIPSDDDENNKSTHDDDVEYTGGMDVDVEEQTQDTITLDTRAQKGWEELPEEERNRVLSAFVRLTLVLEKRKTPVKKEDITSKILRDGSSRLWPAVIYFGNKLLKDTFGFELIERVNPKGIGMGAWYCSNILGEAKAFTPLWGNEKSETGFLITILAYIFIHKGEVTEEQFWIYLKKFGIRQDTVSPSLGDPKELVKTLVKQQYLDLAKVKNTDPPENVFRWGPRAIGQLPKERMIDFIAEIAQPDKRMMAKFREEVLRSYEE